MKGEGVGAGLRYDRYEGGWGVAWLRYNRGVVAGLRYNRGGGCRAQVEPGGRGVQGSGMTGYDMEWVQGLQARAEVSQGAAELR